MAELQRVESEEGSADDGSSGGDEEAEEYLELHIVPLWGLAWVAGFGFERMSGRERKTMMLCVDWC